jgi:hypothetical protein
MSRSAAGHQGPGGIWWNVATPASAVTRTVHPGASGIAAATALNPIRPTTVTRPPPRRTMPPGLAGRWTPRKTTTVNRCAVRAKCRPGSNGSASRDARTRASPAGSPRALSRQALSRQALSRHMAARATAAGPVTACPTVLGRADLRARAGRTAGTQMAACPTGQCRMAVLPTACRTAPPSTAPRRIAPRRTAVPRTAACRTPVSRTPVSRTAGRPTAGRPTAGRYPADSPGCRTGAGYRRALTAFTDRLGLARRAGHQGGTTGRVRPPRTRTPTVGAARRRHRGRGHRGRGHRGLLGPVPEDRPQVRLTGVRSPTAVPGYLGHPGYLGLRRCVSTRPPGRALMLLRAASGGGRRWAHRRNRRRR